MERYKVILAYDGTEFQGFQRQTNTRTVQGVVEAALHRLGWQGQRLLAAGRTDAGVHAVGQVVAFDLDWPHTPQALANALNAYLPPSVAARYVQRVPADFHPRYHADWRTYRYQVICQSTRHPILERYAWRVWPVVDLALLQQSAAILAGVHNFSAFGAPLKRHSHASRNTVRTVFQAGWTDQPPYLVFEITANAFLYHMVRRLVHVQVMVGQAMLPSDAIQEALGLPDVMDDAPQQPLVHGLAPAHGLTLVEVHYPSQALAGAG